MTMMSRSFIILAALSAVAHGQNCPRPPSGQCDFEPFNPHVCGPDYSCSYENICEATTVGYDINNDCCQAPQPSACGMISEPLVCGSKLCPYANSCLAELAGYSSSQCSPAPEECPSNDNGQCSGEPANPFNCGTTTKDCPYENICLAEAAGWNIGADCCQDTRSNTACGMVIAPVSCGAPAGKQCAYDNQCLADAAGYNEKQCCATVPEGIVCAMDNVPVVCGSNPCYYSNQCEATAAGYTEGQCCKQPAPGPCSGESIPHICGSMACVYPNACVAEAAGHDPGSCIKDMSGAMAASETSDAVGKMNGFARFGVMLSSFIALLA